jgi:ribosome maturation protein Sdo1
MVRHDSKSMAADEFCSLQELTDADPVRKNLVSKFRTQQQRVQRLDEYFNQIVTKIRASSIGPKTKRDYKE